MSNNQAKIPMGGQKKTTETRYKEKKTSTIIKSTTISTTGMGVIREKLHRMTH